MLFLLLALTAHAATLNMGMGFYTEETCVTAQADGACEAPCATLFNFAGVVCTKVGGDCVATATVDTTNVANADLRNGDACLTEITGACTQMKDETTQALLPGMFMKQTCEVAAAADACTNGEAGCTTCNAGKTACETCDATHVKNADGINCDLKPKACTAGQGNCDECETDGSACKTCAAAYKVNSGVCEKAACTVGVAGCDECETDRATCKTCAAAQTKNTDGTCFLTCVEGQNNCATCGENADVAKCATCDPNVAGDSTTAGTSYTLNLGVCDASTDCLATKANCKECMAAPDAKKCKTCADDAAPIFYSLGEGLAAGSCTAKTAACEAGAGNCKTCDDTKDYECKACADDTDAKVYTKGTKGDMGTCTEADKPAEPSSAAALVFSFVGLLAMLF